MDILISISYNLLGKEAGLAAAWLNGLCTQSNLLHSQFPVLENLSVSLSEVSIAITAILVKHWKWQLIQIVILLDSNCSSLHWPLKCYFLGGINCNWRRLVLCLCFQPALLPLPPEELCYLFKECEPRLAGRCCWAHHTSTTGKTWHEWCSLQACRSKPSHPTQHAVTWTLSITACRKSYRSVFAFANCKRPEHSKVFSLCRWAYFS